MIAAVDPESQGHGLALFAGHGKRITIGDRGKNGIAIGNHGFFHVGLFIKTLRHFPGLIGKRGMKQSTQNRNIHHLMLNRVPAIVEVSEKFFEFRRLGLMFLAVIITHTINRLPIREQIEQ